MQSQDQNNLAPLKNILWATDFSPASEATLPEALRIARQYRSKLYLAHVISPELTELLPSETMVNIVTEARAFAEQNMESLLQTATEGGVECESLIGAGVIWDELQGMIRDNRIDLVVVGTHGRRGLDKLRLGSVAEEVFRLAPCPVLTVGPKTSEARSRDVELSHILYPVQFVPDPSAAAGYAVSLAEEYHARLTFMKVFEETVPSSDLQAAIEEPVKHWMDDHAPLGSDLRKRTCFEPGFGSAAEAILKFAREHGVDLIVMGVRHFDPVTAAHIPRPDTAYAVVCNAPCPVLTVR